MSRVALWLMPYVLGALGGLVGGVFEHSCPLDAGTWTCGHWAAICAGAGVLLGFLGKKINPWKADPIAQRKDGLRVIQFPPKSKAPEPAAEWGENVGPDDGPAGGPPG